jgi:hypothetical protein
MPYQQIKPHIYNCAVCTTKCDSKTVAQFDFEKDAQFSEQIENEVINLINETYPHLIATKTQQAAYPDIVIAKKNNLNKHIAFIEIKGQARTFMTIATKLPQSQLQPSETVALNLSDLERYFVIKKNENLPLYIVWCLLKRPCIVGSESQNKLFFYREISYLQQIRQSDIQNYRRFRRASGVGDIVNGEHKGVVVNYHFSLNELHGGLPNLKNL